MTMTVGKPTVHDRRQGWAQPDDLDVDSARRVVVRGPAEPEALPPGGGVAEPARDGWAAMAQAHAAAAKTEDAGQAGQALLTGATANAALGEPGLPALPPGTLAIDDYMKDIYVGSTTHNPSTTAANVETAQLHRRDEGIAEAAANIGVGSQNTAAAHEASAAAATGGSSRGDIPTALGAAGAVAVPILTAPAMPASATAGVSATAAVAAAPAGVGGVGAAAQTLANEFGDDPGAQVARGTPRRA